MADLEHGAGYVPSLAASEPEPRHPLTPSDLFNEECDLMVKPVLIGMKDVVLALEL